MNSSPPDTQLNIETILKYQKRDLVLKIVWKKITQSSRPFSQKDLLNMLVHFGWNIAKCFRICELMQILN